MTKVRTRWPRWPYRRHEVILGPVRLGCGPIFHWLPMVVIRQPVRGFGVWWLWFDVALLGNGLAREGL